MSGFVLFCFWPQWWLKGGFCHYQICIKVNAHMKMPQGAQYCSCKQWAAMHLAKVPELCKQPELRGPGGTTAGTSLIQPLQLPEQSPGIHWQPQLQAQLGMDKTLILKTGLFKFELLLTILWKDRTQPNFCQNEHSQTHQHSNIFKLCSYSLD